MPDGPHTSADECIASLRRRLRELAEAARDAEQVDALKARLEVLERVLRFYADRESYREHYSMSRHERPAIELDQGARARLALESDGRAGEHQT